jgi:hypothetical protein
MTDATPTPADAGITPAFETQETLKPENTENAPVTHPEAAGAIVTPATTLTVAATTHDAARATTNDAAPTAESTAPRPTDRAPDVPAGGSAAPNPHDVLFADSRIALALAQRTRR